jgi:hypothetical protein
LTFEDIEGIMVSDVCDLYQASIEDLLWQY